MLNKILKGVLILSFCLLWVTVAYADVYVSSPAEYPVSGSVPGQESTLEATIIYSPTYWPITIYGIDAYVTYEALVFDNNNISLQDYVFKEPGHEQVLTKDINPRFLPGIVKYCAYKMPTDPGWGPFSSKQVVYKLSLPINIWQLQPHDPPFDTVLDWRPGFCTFLDSNWNDVTGTRTPATVKIVERIASIAPVSGAQGETIPLVKIFGDNTEFAQGPVAVTFSGPDGSTMNMTGTAINSYEIHIANMTIPSNATLGLWRVRMEGPQQGGGTEIAIGNNLFEVTGTPAGARINLTAYLNGYWDNLMGSWRPTTIEVELRSNPLQAGTSFRDIVLDQNGNAEVNLPGISAGDYYVVLRHQKIPENGYGINHLPIISLNTVHIDPNGSPVTIQFVNPSGQNWLQPSGFPDSMITEVHNSQTVYTLRGGNATDEANADHAVINTRDFLIWLSQNGQGSGNLAGDFNGDGVVNAGGDFPLWYINNGQESYVHEPTSLPGTP